MAQTLPSEEVEVSLINEVDEDSALQRMTSVLASNCQKLGIGPSFHFDTIENLSSFPEQINGMDEQVTETKRDDKYESVICEGSDVPHEILKDVKVNKLNSQNIEIQPLNVRLAEVPTDVEVLLSPDSGLESSSNSGGSSRGTAYSSGEVFSSSSSGISDPGSSGCRPKSRFSFPKDENRPNYTNNTAELENNAIHEMQRLEIRDEPEISEHEWIKFKEKSIDAEGFSLGIKPGTFYRHKSQPCYYVKLPHRSYFIVTVANNHRVWCDLDLYVNGKHDESLRIAPGAERSIDGPRHSKYKYRIFRAAEAVPGEKVKPGHIENGRIRAVFVPATGKNGIQRSVSEPFNRTAESEPEWVPFDFLKTSNTRKKKRAETFTYNSNEGPKERSLDFFRISEAVVIPHGKEKKKTNYDVAPPMEMDDRNTVTLTLRIIASLDEEYISDEETATTREDRLNKEETATTDEESYCVEPPTVPSIIKRK